MVGYSKSSYLRSFRSGEALPPISPWTTLGGLFLTVTVGMSVILAAVIKYPVTVKSQGTVRPTGELNIVQAATAGKIKSIEVKENQEIKQGDAIAYLGNSQLHSQENQIKGNIQQAERQLAQINAQISNINAQINAEIQVMTRTIASAQADLHRNLKEYQEQQIITWAEVQEAKAALELAKEEMKRYQQLAQTGAVAEVQIKEKEEAFKVAQARLKSAEGKLNPSDASVAMATEQIALAKAQGESTQASLRKERDNLLQKQVETQNQLNSERHKLERINIELGETEILAPDAGTVFQLKLRNSGQVVQPGDVIAKIATARSALVIKARVPAQNIAKVQRCQAAAVNNCTKGKVQLRISAYPYPDYGTLKGALRAIAPDTLGGAMPQMIVPETNNTAAAKSNASSQASGATAPYYEVTIEPERPYLLKNGQQYPLQSGMLVTANIISQEETVLQFLLRRARLVTNL